MYMISYVILCVDLNLLTYVSNPCWFLGGVVISVSRRYVACAAEGVSAHPKSCSARSARRGCSCGIAACELGRAVIDIDIVIVLLWTLLLIMILLLMMILLSLIIIFIYTLHSRLPTPVRTQGVARLPPLHVPPAAVMGWGHQQSVSTMQCISSNLWRDSEAASGEGSPQGKKQMSTLHSLTADC